MKVQLIRPPLDKWYKTGQLTELVSIPAGLCLLSGLVDADVDVLDGLNVSLESMLPRVDADIVGVTELYSSHASALEILKVAKDKGSITVIGGPNVNPLAKQILSNHPFVDYAVVGDGEEALPMLVAGKEVRDIPNLVYRVGDEIVANPRRSVRLKRIFDLDDLVDWQNFDVNTSFPISSVRGCIVAALKARCNFCSIDTSLQIMSPELMWEQIRLANERYGSTFFWETGDTFNIGTLPQKVLAARPDDLSHIKLRMYTIPDQIDDEMMRTLKDLNAERLFFGVETMDDELLRKVGKSYTSEDVLRSLELAEKYGVSLHVPFIYGLPGTTTEIIERDYQAAKSMVEKFPNITMIVSLPVPFPGTGLFEALRKDPRTKVEYNGDLDRDDFFDYEALVRLQTKYFTSVTYEQLVEKVVQTKALVTTPGRITSFAAD